MRKRVLSLFLALMMALALVPAALAAETDKPQRGVLTYSEHIAPQYEEARTFSEDLAAVKQDGKWGYVDHDNNVVIPFQYELAYDFNEGYAVVAKSSRQETTGEGTEWEYTTTYYEMGFIDKAGKYTPFIVEDPRGALFLERLLRPWRQSVPPRRLCGGTAGGHREWGHDGLRTHRACYRGAGACAGNDGRLGKSRLG